MSKQKQAIKHVRTTKPVTKVQIVIYACTHCDNEIEDIKICPLCKHPMRVVEVKEIFGKEAEEILTEVKQNLSLGNTNQDNDSNDNKDSDDFVGDLLDDSLNNPLKEEELDRIGGLDDIFPEDEEEENTPNLSDMLDSLDGDEGNEPNDLPLDDLPPL